MARLVSNIYPYDHDEYIPVGMGFPINVGSPNMNYTTRSQIHDNLRNLILTMKGERVMQPEFGSDLYFLLFEQLYDDDLSKAAFKSINEATKIWMPYIILGPVSVTTQADSTAASVKISYSVQGWDELETLNISVEV